MEQVKAVREAVGPDVDVLVEVHRRLAPMHAVRVAKRMEPYRPFWFEEPVSARDLGGLEQAKRAIDLPVVTGEEIYTKSEFRDVIARRAADILNPDVCNCGGILELREIAAMAEAHHLAISPHNYNSTTVGLAATLQASAGLPNFLITEYFVNFEERGRSIARTPLVVEGGFIALPTAAGIGPIAGSSGFTRCSDVSAHAGVGHETPSALPLQRRLMLRRNPDADSSSRDFPD